MNVRIIVTSFVFGVFFVPGAAFGASMDVAGWIPWWSDSEGIDSAEDHLRDLDTVYPFVFEVATGGTLVDKADITERQWKNFFKKAKKKRVEVIPTISWFDGAAIHEVLHNKKSRSAHIDAVVEMVDDGNFKGVNIDYESKLAETKDDFSLFLKELKAELGRDLLTCTIEARTPPESRWREVPETIEYANDYEAIGRYCDRVEIMAYDQQRVDWKINSEKKGEPYIPVADVDWVEKVVKLALEDIDEDKIMLGVPTYGREWELTVAPEWYKEYDNVRAINMPNAEALAEKYNITPTRNKAGELSFSYFPENSPYKVLSVLPVDKSISEGHKAAAQALLFADATKTEVPVRVVWYSDASAIEDKVDLAEKYDLRGVAIFKIDGEEDPDIWDLF